MELDQEQFERLEELYFELEVLSEDQRRQRLTELAEADAALAERLQRMFGTEPGARRGVLELFRTEAERSSLPSHDRRIANYRILRRLGEGGMGVVYEAEQLEPIRRRVALKLIKWGADSKEVVARFESERQAVALMDHPNVAKVYEAGTSEDGRPYFAMELVDGEPIVDYCDGHQLGTRQRLELLVEACRAVQHAHRKGIIHRDLKPSNILVTEVEGRPQVKIIDFGIAKAISSVHDPETLLTEHGRLVGTPEYMSPEQLQGAEIDTRSDVYSLGVLLFETLAGSLPVSGQELRSWSLAEVGRRLMESETPKLSDRLDPTTAEGREIAGHRRTDPASLARELRGDLDWIVLKALAKDRDQRYESAADLAAELQRFLANEPVLAGPPSFTYRGRKFLRRHRVATAVAAGLLLAVLVGIVGLVVGLRRAQLAEAEARREAETTQEVLDFMSSMLLRGARAAEQGQQLTIPELFERARQQLREKPPQNPVVHAAVLNRLGEFHFMDLQDLDEAERLLADAERLLRETGAAPEELATSLYVQGAIHRNRGDLDEAEKAQQEVLALRRRLHGEDSGPVSSALTELALIARARGNGEEAIATMRRAVEMAERAAEPDHPDLISKRLSLAGMLMFFGHPEEAEELHLDVLERSRRLDLHEYEQVSLNNLGAAAYREGDLAAAMSYLEEAFEITRDELGADPLRLQVLHSNLGMMAAKQGLYDEAIRRLRRSLELITESAGLDSPSGSAVSQLLAEIYLKGARYIDARRQLQVALDLAYRVPPEAPQVSPLRTERNYALLEEAEGNHAAARRRLDRAAAQNDWAQRDPEGVCLLLYERSRLEPDSDRARELFEDAEERCSEQSQQPWVLYARARHLANHGEIERAHDLLHAMADHGVVDVWPALDPALAVLRGKERFEEFLERTSPG